MLGGSTPLTIPSKTSTALIIISATTIRNEQRFSSLEGATFTQISLKVRQDARLPQEAFSLQMISG